MAPPNKMKLTSAELTGRSQLSSGVLRTIVGTQGGEPVSKGSWLRRNIVLLGSAVLTFALAAPGSGSARPELEIQASLYSVNLLPPESLCCAFRLHLQPSGALTTTVTFKGGPVTSNSQLSESELGALRGTLAAARFFDLPKYVGVLPEDGVEHRMHIRLGNRSRTVTLYEWPDDWSTPTTDLSLKELETTRRAHMVWSAIRALIRDTRATVR
jgi:hypothetical protein